MVKIEEVQHLKGKETKFKCDTCGDKATYVGKQIETRGSIYLLENMFHSKHSFACEDHKGNIDKELDIWKH